jgi:hypothetical protein
MVGNTRVTLPAAAVPALAAGDVVDVTYPDYTRPSARVNYHVNVAFITEVSPQHWLFERSSPADRFSQFRKNGTRGRPRRRRRPACTSPGAIFRRRLRSSRAAADRVVPRPAPERLETLHPHQSQGVRVSADDAESRLASEHSVGV